MIKFILCFYSNMGGGSKNIVCSLVYGTLKFEKWDNRTSRGGYFDVIGLIIVRVSIYRIGSFVGIDYIFRYSFESCILR